VGFNVLGFDDPVLRGDTDRDVARLPTFDLLDAIRARIAKSPALVGRQVSFMRHSARDQGLPWCGREVEALPGAASLSPEGGCRR
jgi:hypothetical protein